MPYDARNAPNLSACRTIPLHRPFQISLVLLATRPIQENFCLSADS
jgi:hypothetical protein